jgi:hypothetical protein
MKGVKNLGIHKQFDGKVLHKVIHRPAMTKTASAAEIAVQAKLDR